MPIGLGASLGIGGGRSSTSSGAPTGGATPFANTLSSSYDGTDEYLNIPHASSLTIAGDMTISAWVKRTELVNASAGGYFPILTKRSGTVGDTNYQFYCDAADGTAAGGLRFYDGNSVISPASATVIPAGAWTHVVIAIDSGATNGVKWYVNGSAEANTNTATNDNSNTDPVMIGKLGAANYYAKGQIDEVALWDSALTAAQVANIYRGEENGGSGGTNGTPGDLATFSPLGWWRMGDGTGDTDSGGGTPASGDDIGTVADQVSGGNNAAGANDPTFSSDIP